MNKYEITIPSAAGMLEQEKLSQTERNLERVNPCAYNLKDVADDVRDYVSRDHWCNTGGQQIYVDHLRALVNSMGNVRDWQLALLEETRQQILENRSIPMLGTRAYQDPKDPVTTYRVRGWK
jgi:hypothetical protein